MSDMQWIASFFLLYMFTGLAVMLWFAPALLKSGKFAKIKKREMP